MKTGLVVVAYVTLMTAALWLVLAFASADDGGGDDGRWPTCPTPVSCEAMVRR
jgi:hypothetical protein